MFFGLGLSVCEKSGDKLARVYMSLGVKGRKKNTLHFRMDVGRCF